MSVFKRVDLRVSVTMANDLRPAETIYDEYIKRKCFSGKQNVLV